MKHIFMLMTIWLMFLKPAYSLETGIDGKDAVIGDGLGVELRIGADGRLSSITSTYSHPADFPDRRGVNKAYIIAEEKAKAAIARFLQQTVTTTRAVTEIDKGLEIASQKRSSEGQSWTKDNTRKVEETLSEISGSSATAVLRGVKVISRKYDEKDGEVTVVVGINSESEAAAQQLRGGINNGKSSPTSQSGGGFPSIPSEERKSRDASKY